LIMDTTQGFEPYPRYPYAIKTDATATPFWSRWWVCHNQWDSYYYY
jgi:hypothetical protein